MVFAASTLPRSLISTYLVTGALQIHQTDLLTLSFSVKAIQGGKWREARLAEGWTLGQMLQHLAEHMELFEGQDVAGGMKKLGEFITGGIDGENLTVTLAHEPATSLWLAQNGGLSKEQIGLEDAQAYVVFMNDEDIVGVQKFTPDATMPASIL